MAKHHFLYPRIDAKQTSRAFVDLRSFLKVVFHNELHEEIAEAIIEFLVKNKQGYLMKQIIPFVQQTKKISHNKSNKGKKTIVSKDTIGKVFKAMWKSGLLNKKYRYDPVQLSKTFSLRLRDLADYWQNYVEQYG